MNSNERFGFEIACKDEKCTFNWKQLCTANVGNARVLKHLNGCCACVKALDKL